MIIALVVTAIVGIALGTYFGKEIGGTTIGGLKFAMVFWPAVITIVVGAIAGAIAGATITVALAGLGTSLVGSLIGHLTR